MKCNNVWFKSVSWLVLSCFIFSPAGFTAGPVAVNLPLPNQMLALSQPVSHPALRGIKINPENPLQIAFIVDPQGQANITKDECDRLTGYFMAALTIPEEDLWVNLSPYEKDRIIPEALSQTDFGEGLLEEDYLLKQLAASLTYPESEPGRSYWQAINNPVGAGHDRPVASFQKVWIVPESAEIYENANVAIIIKSGLKVMTEKDYLATQAATASVGGKPNAVSRGASDARDEAIASNAFKAHILPLIEKDVNTGEHFARLRQMHSSFLLASWFKNKLRESFFKYYIDQKHVKGIDLADKNVKEKVFNQYVQAFTQGAYNYIKKERVGGQRTTRRQYFSGGIAEGGGVGSGARITHKFPTVVFLSTAVFVLAGIIGCGGKVGNDGLTITTVPAPSSSAPPGTQDAGMWGGWAEGRQGSITDAGPDATPGERITYGGGTSVPFPGNGGKPGSTGGASSTGGQPAATGGNPATGGSSAAATGGAVTTLPSLTGGAGNISDTVVPFAYSIDDLLKRLQASIPADIWNTIPEDSLLALMQVMVKNNVAPEDAGYLITKLGAHMIQGITRALEVPGLFTNVQQRWSAGDMAVTAEVSIIAAGQADWTNNWSDVSTQFSLRISGSQAHKDYVVRELAQLSQTLGVSALVMLADHPIFNDPSVDIADAVQIVELANMLGKSDADVKTLWQTTADEAKRQYQSGAPQPSVYAAVLEQELYGLSLTDSIAAQITIAKNQSTDLAAKGVVIDTPDPSMTVSDLVPLDLEERANSGGNSKKAGSDWQPVSDTERNRIIDLVDRGFGSSHLIPLSARGSGETLTGFLTIDHKMSFDKRGCNIETNSHQRVIALRPDLTPEISAYVIGHEEAEIRVDIHDKAGVQRVARNAERRSGERVPYERALHMVVSIYERATWIKDKKDGLLAVDEEDLQGYDIETLRGLIMDRRALQHGVAEGYFGRNSPEARNARAYETQFKRRAFQILHEKLQQTPADGQGTGGIKLTYTAKVSTGLTPITIKVDPRIEAMFKTAAEVDFKVGKFGEKVSLNKFAGR